MFNIMFCLSKENEHTFCLRVKGHDMFHGKSPFVGNLVEREEIGQRKIRLTLDVSAAGNGVDFQIGDHVAVFPRNEVDEVTKLVEKVMNVDSENSLMKRKMRSMYSYAGYTYV